jgi:hypothetical protein
MRPSTSQWDKFLLHVSGRCWDGTDRRYGPPQLETSRICQRRDRHRRPSPKDRCRKGDPLRPDERAANPATRRRRRCPTVRRCGRERTPGQTGSLRIKKQVEFSILPISFPP